MCVCLCVCVCVCASESVSVFPILCLSRELADLKKASAASDNAIKVSSSCACECVQVQRCQPAPLPRPPGGNTECRDVCQGGAKGNSGAAQAGGLAREGPAADAGDVLCVVELVVELGTVSSRKFGKLCSMDPPTLAASRLTD